MSSDAVVKTALGEIHGQVITSPLGTVVHEYLGIPYAKPPVGQLRFCDPQPLDKLPKDPYIAVEYGNSCTQQADTTFGDFPGSCMWNAPNTCSEDCLYLNVWTPPPVQTQPKAVLVWIYGGGFYNGTSALAIYNGATLAGHGDLIVVSFNYRTSVFGFFSTGDGQVKGNYGLKDQHLVLKWIRQHISAFGGDPDNITVIGESAGSASIGYHLISPYFEPGLFHKAVMQSGSPTSPWAYMSKQEAGRRSQEFLKRVGYTENNNEDVLKYLRTLDVETLLEHDWVEMDNTLYYPWVPTVDGDYVTDHPNTLLRNNQLHSVDTVFGCTKNEGSWWCVYNLPNFSKDEQECPQTYEQYLNCQPIMNSDLPKDLIQDISTFYTKNQIVDTSDQVANRRALDTIIGDRQIVWPTTEMAQALCRNGANVFQYYLSHRASNEVWPEWMGVIHAADIQWTFGNPLKEPNTYTKEERDFSKAVMTYIANFAKFSDPSISGTSKWPEYTTQHKRYLEWRGPEDFQTGASLREKFCHFLEQLEENTAK